MLRQSIDTTVALFGRAGDGTTLVELVDWFVLDIRGIDHTSAARLLPPHVTPAEIADPTGIELRSFSPRDIADTSPPCCWRRERDYPQAVDGGRC